MRAWRWSPRRWEDRTLRRCAWALWCVQVAVVAVAVPVSLVAPTTEATWGLPMGEWMWGALVLTFPLTGLLILVRQPGNRIGWVLHAIGTAWTLDLLMDVYTTVGLVIRPGSLPVAEFAAAVYESTWVVIILPMGTFLVLLFPDGHLPSRRWRPLAWTSAVLMLVVPVLMVLTPGTMEEAPVPGMQNPLGLEGASGPLTVLMGVFLPLVPLCILASAVSLVVRFRKARGVARQQLKWLTLAVAVVALLYGATMLATVVGGSTTSGEDAFGVRLLQTASLGSFVLVPAAIGIAVLRHRLFDIDVVINRALVYATLTAALALAYVGSVLLLQLVLSRLTASSDLAVAGSTLAVAALFRPLRAHVQRVVDRRFFRRRYDAERTLATFGTRLRSELDLQAVGDDLRAVVDRTVQPSSVRLWLRGAP